MIREIGQAIKLAFGVVSLRRHLEVLAAYDQIIDAQDDMIQDLSDRIDSLELQVADLEDFTVSIPGVAEIEVHHEPYTEEDHAIAQMEHDGVIDPNHYRGD